MNSHEVFIHIHQGCFAGTGAIVRLPQCQWSKPDGYGKISQCITTPKHSKAKTVCIFLGIYYIRCRCTTAESGFVGLALTVSRRHLHCLWNTSMAAILGINTFRICFTWPVWTRVTHYRGNHTVIYFLSIDKQLKFRITVCHNWEYTQTKLQTFGNKTQKYTSSYFTALSCSTCVFYLTIRRPIEDWNGSLVW